MKIIDLFSGGGGLSEGFRQTGKFQFVFHVEKDSSACLTLQLRNIYYYLKNIDNISRYKEFLEEEISLEELFQNVPEEIINDVLNYEINDDSLEVIFEYIDSSLIDKQLDGIIGGPPCQPYSMIGRANNKHRKASDPRIYLYEYYLDFLNRYNPKFFIFENVKGLLSFKNNDKNLLFPIILDGFDKVGYSVSYRIINSEDYGVSQKRERLFIVGIRKDIELKKAYFDILESYKETAPVIHELFGDLPEMKAGMSLNEYRKNTSNQLVFHQYRKPETDVLTQHVARPHNDNDLKIYKLVAEAKSKGLNLRYNDLPENLRTHTNTKSFIDRFKAIDEKDVCHTVVAHISKDGHFYIHPDIKQNRSISVREAARIQGFPDDYYFLSSRTSAFSQIGNAVPPILANKLAHSILDLFEEVE